MLLTQSSWDKTLLSCVIYSNNFDYAYIYIHICFIILKKYVIFNFSKNIIYHKGLK